MWCSTMYVLLTDLVMNWGPKRWGGLYVPALGWGVFKGEQGPGRGY